MKPAIPALDPTKLRAASCLVDMTEARRRLRRDEKAIMDLLEGGEIDWAFDLRRAGTGRRYIRIFDPSLVAYVEGRNGAVDRTLDDVLDAILPAECDGVDQTGRLYRASRLAAVLNCDRAHVHNLIGCGALELADAKIQHTSSPLVRRSSVVAFLEKRRLT